MLKESLCSITLHTTASSVALHDETLVAGFNLVALRAVRNRVRATRSDDVM